MKILNEHDVIIILKWRHKVVKLRHSRKYSDYFIMRYLNADFCTDSEIENWNVNVMVLNYHGVIITSKWRHKDVQLRHSLKLSDYFIMRYLNAVFCTDSEIKNWNTNVKVLNDHAFIITSKWRHNVVILRHSLNIAIISLLDIWKRFFALTPKFKTEIRMQMF